MMEEKILEILEQELSGYQLVDNDDPILIAGTSFAAKEITAHIYEFIEWMLQSIEVVPYSTGYYLIGSGLDYMSCNELYLYWLNNIKSK